MASQTDSENKIFKSVRYYLIGSLEEGVSIFSIFLIRPKSFSLFLTI